MANILPSYTDNVSVIAPVAVTTGNLVRGTLDLSTKIGAWIYIGIGHGGTTGLTNGANVEVRRMINAGGILMPGCPVFAVVSQTAVSYLKQINNNPGPYTAGTSAFVVDGAGTPAADEDLCFWGVTAIPANGTSLPNLEFLRVSKWTGASNTVTVDSACKIQKIDNEYFTNKADNFLVRVDGGCQYEVIVDYGDDTAGEALAVVAYAQTYDKDTA